MATLPYITTPGNITKALDGIKTAATPPTVSQDFVKTILKIGSSSGNEMTSYLRKIGFSGVDGKPSDIYTQFRNAASTAQAALASLKHGYAPLYKRNEYMHDLTDDKLRGIVVEETGLAADARPIALIVSCIKQLKKYVPTGTAGAAVTVIVPDNSKKEDNADHNARSGEQFRNSGVRMNLGYTINLNLPATSDVAVFNAIFKSLKENLLKGAADDND